MPQLAKPPAQPGRPQEDDPAPAPVKPVPTGWVARLEASVSGWRSRRLRDARLLDLGALVFELHREGRREPELLRAKAAAVDELDGQPGLEHSRAEAAGRCRECNAPLGPAQVACLRCGGRVALGEPHPDRLPLLGLATAVVLVGLVCFGFALSELTSDETAVVAQDEPVFRAAAPDAGPEGIGLGVDASEAPAADRPQADVAGYTATGDSDAAGEQAGGGEAPAGEPAGAGQAAAVTPPGNADEASARSPGGPEYTVVLVTSSDGDGARRVAQKAARSGLEVGLLRSDDYSDLGEGLWIVATGRHEDRAQAERRATKLGERYPGAYPQRLDPEAAS